MQLPPYGMVHDGGHCKIWKKMSVLPVGLLQILNPNTPGACAPGMGRRGQGGHSDKRESVWLAFVGVQYCSNSNAAGLCAAPAAGIRRSGTRRPQTKKEGRVGIGVFTPSVRRRGQGSPQTKRECLWLAFVDFIGVQCHFNPNIILTLISQGSVPPGMRRGTRRPSDKWGRPMIGILLVYSTVRVKYGKVWKY